MEFDNSKITSLMLHTEHTVLENLEACTSSLYSSTIVQDYLYSHSLYTVEEYFNANRQ